jgi:uncharacterized protein YajQ (UPF0234 family)
MPSFDAMLEPNWVEIRNAVEQAGKEIGTRFDFKGTAAAVESVAGSGATKVAELVLHGDSDFQLEQVRDVLVARLVKRGVDARFVDFSAKPQKMGGDKLRLSAPVKSGIDAGHARQIQQLVKSSKLKVQAAVQGDVVRISGAKRDELQAVIALLRREVADLPLAFSNFRD